MWFRAAKQLSPAADAHARMRCVGDARMAMTVWINPPAGFDDLGRLGEFILADRGSRLGSTGMPGSAVASSM